MKRYIRSDESAKYIIVTIEVDITLSASYYSHETESVAASFTGDNNKIHIHRVSSMPPKFDLSDDDLEKYENVVNSVYNIVSSDFGFIVTDHYQSHTYSYYIEFHPVDDKMNILHKIGLVQFRISNHDTGRALGDVSKKLRRYNFTFKGIQYPTEEELLSAVYDTCGRLMM